MMKLSIRKGALKTVIQFGLESITIISILGKEGKIIMGNLHEMNQELSLKKIFLSIRRKKSTIYLTVEETDTVLEVKKQLQGILKVAPEDQSLLYQANTLMDQKPLSFYGINEQTARAHNPAVIALCYRDANGQFEEVDITPYSKPPEMPEVMRCQENQPPRPAVSAAGSSTEAAASRP